MQEPVPGISAVPNEQNARYFHVIVTGPQGVSSCLIAYPHKEHFSLPESIRTRCIQTRALSPRRISYGGTKSSFHDKNLPSEYRQTRSHLFGHSQRCSSLLFLLSFSHLSLSFSDKWSPALQIRTVLLSIQALLSAPNPDDPLATDVAEQWKTNETEAIRLGLQPISAPPKSALLTLSISILAREWTRMYAMSD